jgi:hypothetical protein
LNVELNVCFPPSAYLTDVGRSGEALELARLSLANDRYKVWKIARVLRTLEVQRHSSEAEQLFRQGNRWWPNHEGLIGQRWVGMLARGDFDAIERFERSLPKEDRTPPDVLSAIRSGNVAVAKRLCVKPTAPYLRRLRWCLRDS